MKDLKDYIGKVELECHDVLRRDGETRERVAIVFPNVRSTDWCYPLEINEGRNRIAIIYYGRAYATFVFDEAANTVEMYAGDFINPTTTSLALVDTPIDKENDAFIAAFNSNAADIVKILNKILFSAEQDAKENEDDNEEYYEEAEIIKDDDDECERSTRICNLITRLDQIRATQLLLEANMAEIKAELEELKSM
jgi:hypothetical protein